MKTKLLIAGILLASIGRSEPSEAFWRALHLVETGGRHGAIVGDNGAALGPLQIHRSYFADARVGGRYEQVADLQFARRVVTSYLKRYAPKAWATGDVETLARVHNGGPRGAQKPQTTKYAQSVIRNLKK
jgi:hypothetical protein